MKYAKEVLDLMSAFPGRSGAWPNWCATPLAAASWRAAG